MKPQMEHEPKYDAQTLAEAETIKADKARYVAAGSAAKQLAKDATIQAEVYKALTKHTYDHPDSVKARQERGEPN